MCDGRMAFADAVPLLPARARAAVAELLTRGLDHATAKALATDLSAVLRPYTQGADARPRKLIADALSLWLHEAGDLPQTSLLLRSAVRSISAGCERRAAPLACAAHVVVRLPACVRHADLHARWCWLQLVVLVLTIVREASAQDGSLAQVWLWCAIPLLNVLQLAGKRWPAARSRCVAWLPRFARRVPVNCATRLWRAGFIIACVVMRPAHSTFVLSRGSMVDLGYLGAVQVCEPMPGLMPALVQLFLAEVPALVWCNHFTVVAGGLPPTSLPLLLRSLAYILTLVLINVHVHCNTRKLKSV